MAQPAEKRVFSRSRDFPSLAAYRGRFLAVMFTERGERRPPDEYALVTPSNGAAMKKDPSRAPTRPQPPALDDIRPVYDFSGGRRNRYAAVCAAGTNAVLLDPDVAVVFPTATEVNEALRALAGIIAKHCPERDRSRSTA